MKKRKVTPRQAGSARTLDRAQKQLRLILPRVAYLYAELRGLLARLERSERR